mgnify:CR=1 FL=1
MLARYQYSRENCTMSSVTSSEFRNRATLPGVMPGFHDHVADLYDSTLRRYEDCKNKAPYQYMRTRLIAIQRIMDTTVFLADDEEVYTQRRLFARRLELLTLEGSVDHQLAADIHTIFDTGTEPIPEDYIGGIKLSTNRVATMLLEKFALEKIEANKPPLAKELISPNAQTLKDAALSINMLAKLGPRIAEGETPLQTYLGVRQGDSKVVRKKHLREEHGELLIAASNVVQEISNQS